MIPVLSKAKAMKNRTHRASNFFYALRHRDFYPLDALNEIDPDFDEYNISKDVFVEEPYRCKSTVVGEKVVRGYKKAENGEDDEDK